MGRKYDVSVVIPVHNTDMRLLKNCFESVKKQSCGFEHIEMIVVLHNNEESLDNEVKEILGGYDNVIIEVLKNDVHSPSSPRNRGIDLATGEYIGFLDADDMYTVKCLAMAMRYMKETDSDICHFRRMVELEKESGIILNELVLWDQTRETIVVSRDNWEGDKLFVGQWGMCTSKLYLRKFLVDNNIRFSDDVRFAEDYDFSIEAYGRARRIVLAPQLIGYVYEINSKSLVQTTHVDDQVVIDYAMGFKKIFDKGDRFGLYMNDSVAMLVLYEAVLLFNTKELKDETRAKVKEILEPYIRKLKPIPPSKVYPDGRCERMNTYPYMFILGEPVAGKHLIMNASDAFRPVTVVDYQSHILSKLLKLGDSTDYGKRYGFSSIYTLEDYRNILPVTGYDDYQPMINLTIHLGENGIFTDRPITRYVLTHGSLGVPQRLPMTDRVMDRYVTAYSELIGNGRYFPMYESMPYKSSGKSMDNKYTNTIHGLIQSAYIEKNVQDSGKRATSVVPPDIMFPTEFNSFEYARMAYALADKTLKTVYAPNAWTLYSGIRMLIKKWKDLCEDVRNGKVTGNKDISAELQEKINNRLSPLPERADELIGLFEKGEFSFKKIWPELEKVVADGSGSYAIYKEKSKKYLEGVSYSNGILADEICIYGAAVPDEDVFRLDLSNGFYEFMKEDGTTVFAFELETGTRYCLIVSTGNGLYRYKSKIIIRPVKVDEREILVEKCCPLTYDLHEMDDLYEEDVYGVVKKAEEKYGISISDFSLARHPYEGGFIMILEPESVADYEKAKTFDTREVSTFIKEELEKCHGGPELLLSAFFSEPEFGFLYRELNMYRKKVLADAVNPPHVIEVQIRKRERK